MVRSQAGLPHAENWEPAKAERRRMKSLILPPRFPGQRDVETRTHFWTVELSGGMGSS